MGQYPNVSTLTLLVILSCNLHYGEGISRCGQHALTSASFPRHHSLHRQRSTTRTFSRKGSAFYDPDRRNREYWIEPFRRTIPAARSKRAKKPVDSEQSKSPISESDDPFIQARTTEEIYSSLNPVGRCVAGSVEIAVSTFMEYVTGFLGGYVIGTITDVPAVLMKKSDPNQNFPLMQEISKRCGRMHSKSFRWAKSWAEISAAFGGFRVATRVVRGGKEDEWNTILSSAAAGAFFARKEGPQAMLRSAVMYGGLVYFLSGNMFNGKKEPFLYQDQPVDF